MKPNRYQDAGVSVERGDEFARSIATRASEAIGAIGGFAGGIELDPTRWKRPVLLSTTDGVGTKLLVAKEFGDYSGVGIDLVAMCVNDLAVCGAQPMAFLDYIACGRIDRGVLDRVIDGVVAGCEQAGCTLAGGETAEMPDLYAVDDIDLAGFAVGIVEADERLPRSDSICAGDLLVALASSGVHSNGLSLARKALDRDDPMRRRLLEPTRIYVRELIAAAPHIKAAAHITGGGPVSNVSRVLPADLKPVFSWEWKVPEVFDAIARGGSVAVGEMRAVFNMGIGVVMVIARDRLALLERAVSEPILVVGAVEPRDG
ncbi:MAG: phosphoribosylformylglycinamidine cyclo-ligase [Spirochaetaceae bacterium]|nr:MAG: phosphoribosylformylglycinamidine cyclo-ligase [Spirochaetaceae bacterium]